MRRLGYYSPRFPYPQGRSAGPYPKFLSMPNGCLMSIGDDTNPTYYQGTVTFSPDLMGQWLQSNWQLVAAGVLGALGLVMLLRQRR